MPGLNRLRLRAGPGGRRGPRVPREADFTSPLRGPALASRVGLWLGVCFVVAFLTGLYSHLAREATPLVALPTSPVWVYRVTQGLHVASGTAAVPLLLVKLWSVYPRLFTRPPWRRHRALGRHLAERASVAVLVAAAVFQLGTGLANVTRWYPWPFSFRSAHYALAWVAVGALLVHVAVKLPVIGRSLRGGVDEDSPDAHRAQPHPAPQGSGLSRRGLLRTTAVAAAVAALSSATAGAPGLRRLAVLAPVSGDGPQGVPVNRTARAARVTATALAPDYRLTLVHAGHERSLSRADLEAMPQRTARLPIACVEGWSAAGSWTGVPVRDLLAAVGAPPTAAVRVTSLQPYGALRHSRLPGGFVADPDTLLALRLNGEPLSPDHGYPCRIIAPNRPGVLQTKWVHRLEVET